MVSNGTRRRILETYGYGTPSSANVLKYGRNIVGVALRDLNDELFTLVTFRPLRNQPGIISVLPDTGTYHQRVNTDPDTNLATYTIRKMFDFYIQGWERNFGIQIESQTNTPVAVGLGSSAAYIVAAIEAASSFLDVEHRITVPTNHKLYWAGQGEVLTAGRPLPDNDVALIYGGFARLLRMGTTPDETRGEVINNTSRWRVVLAKPTEVEEKLGGSTEEVIEQLRGLGYSSEVLPDYAVVFNRLLPALRKQDIDEASQITAGSHPVELDRARLGIYGQGITPELYTRWHPRFASNHLPINYSGTGPFVAIFCDIDRYPNSESTAIEMATEMHREAGYSTDTIRAEVNNAPSERLRPQPLFE